MNYPCRLLLLALLSYCLFSCRESSLKLKVVRVSDFAKFVEATGYKTIAERTGWSFVQETVFSYQPKQGVSWLLPNGKDTANPNFPVTQVSYEDALAYCKWSKSRLPSYAEYWELVKADKRPIVSMETDIIDASQANIVGNVWEITQTQNGLGEVRLAGGSFLCTPSTCDGTNPERKLFVSQDTGNLNIGFAVFSD